MLNWSDFDNLRVVKRLKSITSSWWNAEIIFSDDKGVIRNIDREKPQVFSNKLFNMIIKSPRGLDIIEEFCRKNIAGGKITKTTFKDWEEAGLPMLMVPIYLDDNFSGAVIATAFFADSGKEKGNEKLYKTMRDLGYTSKDIESALAECQPIAKGQLDHFKELVELIASEIETLHEEITMRENKI